MKIPINHLMIAIGAVILTITIISFITYAVIREIREIRKVIKERKQKEKNQEIIYKKRVKIEKTDKNETM